MASKDFSNYTSPFSWRYGFGKMRKIFSEEYKFRVWRRVWVALAQAQHEAGLVSKEELADLKKHEQDIDIERILEIEKETKHDVVAAIREFAEKAKFGGGKIHLGATSMDVVDNAETIRIQEALHLIEESLMAVLQSIKEQIKRYAGLPCIGYTHLQPAEPTTVGYRLSFYAHNLLMDFELLQFVKQHFEAKGFKGATGTAACYTALLEGRAKETFELEKKISEHLGVKPALVTSQVQTRKQDFFVLSLLASISSSLAKFAGDLRILQSANFGEWSEPFGERQVGSSAMPFKKNPVGAEKICSLARYVNYLPAIALENATLSYLERTLDDSANRRIIIPEGFLATEEILLTAEKILQGLIINKERIAENLTRYAPFAATEAVLAEAVKNGADRQAMHEVLRQISLQAWQEVQKGKANPIQELLLSNNQLSKYLKPEEIEKLMDVTAHVGTAPQRALELVKKISKIT